MQVMEPIFLLVKSVLGDKMRRYVALLVMETANQHPGIAHFEDPKLHDQLQRVQHVEGSSADLVIYAFQAGSNFLGVDFRSHLSIPVSSTGILPANALCTTLRLGTL